MRISMVRITAQKANSRTRCHIRSPETTAPTLPSASAALEPPHERHARPVPRQPARPPRRGRRSRRPGRPATPRPATGDDRAARRRGARPAASPSTPIAPARRWLPRSSPTTPPTACCATWHAPDAGFDTAAGWLWPRAWRLPSRDGAARLAILGDDPNLLAGQDPDKVARANRAARSIAYRPALVLITNSRDQLDYRRLRHAGLGARGVPGACPRCVEAVARSVGRRFLPPPASRRTTRSPGGRRTTRR